MTWVDEVLGDEDSGPGPVIRVTMGGSRDSFYFVGVCDDGHGHVATTGAVTASVSADEATSLASKVEAIDGHEERVKLVRGWLAMRSVG